jgi:hypothetical protein
MAGAVAAHHSTSSRRRIVFGLVLRYAHYPCVLLKVDSHCKQHECVGVCANSAGSKLGTQYTSVCSVDLFGSEVRAQDGVGKLVKHDGTSRCHVI